MRSACCMKGKNLLTVLSTGQKELNHIHWLVMRCTAAGFKILVFLFLVMKMVVWLSGCEKEFFDLILLLCCTYKCFILNNITGLHHFVTIIFLIIFSVGTWYCMQMIFARSCATWISTNFLYNLTHGLLTWYGLFSLLCILSSLLFYDIVLLCVTVFLLCIVLFIVVVCLLVMYVLLP
jgi:hypothetical protein